CFFFLLCFSLREPGCWLSYRTYTVVREGDSVTLNCSQKGSTFTAMYWYKLPTGKDATLQLVCSTFGLAESSEKSLPSSGEVLEETSLSAHMVLLCLWSLPQVHCSLHIPQRLTPAGPNAALGWACFTWPWWRGLGPAS
uniref:Immunoglobulin V-set domain-containing protein n=1 Tax=Calidris pygmaea TaxID=425635 RepID=A0A8C3JL99_9CHAR